jgi:predicted restriction endonuclease
MNKRKSIPAELEKELYMEAGWRCAVPSCRVSKPLEMAHIEPVKPNGETDNFNNIIVLCRNCHAGFDERTDKRMTQAMIKIKQNLMILNGRYSHLA